MTAPFHQEAGVSSDSRRDSASVGAPLKDVEDRRLSLKSYGHRDTSPMPSGPRTNVSKKKQRWRWALKIWDLVVDQWFLIVMGILIAFASQVQVPKSHQQLKQTVVNYLAVAIIFFINGCTLPTQVLVENLSRWKVHIFTQVQCYLLTSSISYGIVSASATDKHFMDPALLIGIIILGCLPTAISFNTIMTRKANGNGALSIAQSTIGNLLGPFLTTALIKLYTGTGAWYTDILPETEGFTKTYRYVFKQLGLSVFVPLLAGQIMASVFPHLVKTVFTEWKLNKLSSFALLVVIWSTYDGAFESDAFSGVRSDNMVFVVFILIALFLVCIAITTLVSWLWLSREDTIAVAYLVPTKTPAMGVPITTIMFMGLPEAAQSRMKLPMVIYQGIQTTLSSLLTIPLRKWQATEPAKRQLVQAETLELSDQLQDTGSHRRPTNNRSNLPRFNLKRNREHEPSSSTQNKTSCPKNAAPNAILRPQSRQQKKPGVRPGPPGTLGQKRKKTIFDSDSDSESKDTGSGEVEISTLGGLEGTKSTSASSTKPSATEPPAKRKVPFGGGATGKPNVKPLSKSSIFADDDDDETTEKQTGDSGVSFGLNTKKGGGGGSAAGNKEYVNLSAMHSSKKHAQDAEELDPSIYSYDAVYESLHAKPGKEKAAAENKSEGPRYMGSLLRSAEIRKRDQLRARDRMLAKEREAEGDEFADKEKFVTSSYKKQQEELRKIEEEEAERERQEEERRKQNGSTGMVDFYRDILSRGEQQHEAVMKATEEAARRVQAGEAPEETEELKEKTEAQKAEELNARGAHIAINDEGQVVDKRQLLSAGLNAAPKPKQQPSTATAAGSRASAPRSRFQSEQQSARVGQRARQTEMIASQLEERAQQEEAAETARQKEIAERSRSRKTEGDVSSAKERYLARKREREAAAKGKGA
ncbi:sodium bile acid symporter family protein [Aspergillus bombycis]|uniref:Sodium bile acid symporter family protein n=1 Tax=Aspergillus bombycis TaxID=109264 RepID=A0A1F7ZZU2_9EURO|nr:sodium bile acid symporter family protein [Aspergillus bombycis]OGM44971.1 sodium bile acid symporter family protein [Aspergillus bombycis]